MCPPERLSQSGIAPDAASARHRLTLVVFLVISAKKTSREQSSFMLGGLPWVMRWAAGGVTTALPPFCDTQAWQLTDGRQTFANEYEEVGGED